VDDLREAIRRDLDRLVPTPTAFDDAMRRVRRRERRRRASAGVLGLGLTVALALGLWTAVDRSGDRDTTPGSPSEAADLGEFRLFLSGDGEAWVVDPTTETARHLDIPELSPGDPPHRVVRRDDVLVAWSYRTLILDPREDWEPRVLAPDSLIFIPAASPDRVWVGILDEDRPDQGLQAVREMTVTGEVTVPDTRPPGGLWPIAAVNQGLVFQEPTGLHVWDPKTGSTIDRLPGDFPLAWQGDLLAWCDHDCGEVRLTAFATGREIVVPAPAGTVGFEALQGAFSPDGATLAVAVHVDPGPDADRQLALIDVATGRLTLVDDATVDTGYVFIDWTPSGGSVFITGGQDAERRRVVEYRIGDVAADVIDVQVGSFYGMAVVDTAGRRTGS
jgi:hypothetical protein